MMPVAGLLCAGDVTHGVVEGQSQDLDMEVNGVAGEVALRPAPVAVFDDEAGIGGQNKIARLTRHELESMFLQQRRQGREPGGADLLTRPPGAIPGGGWPCVLECCRAHQANRRLFCFRLPTHNCEPL